TCSSRYHKMHPLDMHHLSLPDALPISPSAWSCDRYSRGERAGKRMFHLSIRFSRWVRVAFRPGPLPSPLPGPSPTPLPPPPGPRPEEHTSELQSPDHLVSRLLLENKK